jgi:hypothetical protein
MHIYTNQHLKFSERANKNSGGGGYERADFNAHTAATVSRSEPRRHVSSRHTVWYFCAKFSVLNYCHASTLNVATETVADNTRIKCAGLLNDAFLTVSVICIKRNVRTLKDMKGMLCDILVE